jgi:hypothetical protein
MRSNLLVLLTGCVVAVFVSAQAFPPTDVAWMGAQNVSSGGATPPSYLLDETFETNPGYDNAGWVESGTVDEDFSTAGLSLDGSECLKLDSTGGSDASAYNTNTASSSVCLYFKTRFETMPDSTGRSLAQINTNTTVCALLQCSSNGLFRISAAGGAAVFLTDTFTNDVTYHVWMTYDKGTGADAKATCGFSTDGTRPLSGNSYAESVNGTSTASVNRFYLRSDQNGSGFIGYFDHILLDDVAIGDNP